MKDGNAQTIGFVGNNLVWISIVSVFAILVAGCAADRKNTAPEAIFLNADTLAGKRVTVTGYLRYEFENRSIYPREASVRKAERDACLPILVERGNDAMDKDLASFNGSVVTVTGTVVSLVEPGMSVVGPCKDVGLAIESIHKN